MPSQLSQPPPSSLSAALSKFSTLQSAIASSKSTRTKSRLAHRYAAFAESASLPLFQRPSREANPVPDPLRARDGGQRQVPILGSDGPAAGVCTLEVSLVTPGSRAQHLQARLSAQVRGYRGHSPESASTGALPPRASCHFATWTMPTISSWSRSSTWVTLGYYDRER